MAKKLKNGNGNGNGDGGEGSLKNANLIIKTDLDYANENTSPLTNFPFNLKSL